MHDADVLVELVVVLGTAAVTTILFQLLRQPVALGYLLAGLVIGPHVSIPLVADPALVSTLSELGVILLMFSIGLEFSVRTIAKVGLGAALTAGVEVAMMITVGYLIGRALGWSATEALFLAGCLSISSTMLVARSLDEQRGPEGFSGMVLAILVFEDLIAIVLLAVLTAVASGADLTGDRLARLLAELGGFLAVMLIVGLLVIPRVVRWIARMGRGEILLITALAICFGMAALASEFGFSVALGAFIAGLLIAESGRGHEIAALIRPFRDVFAAVFFVSVGMTIVPGAFVDHAAVIVLLSVVVIVGKATGVTAGVFLAGHGLRSAVRAGLTLGQIGELSFVIAGLVGGKLLPIVVGVSCLTAFTTPWLVRGADRTSSWLDAHLPRRLQTFVTFYGSWIERLRSTPRRDTLWRRGRGLLAVLIVDAALLGATAIATVVIAPREVGVGQIGVTAAGVLVGGLFALGVARCVRRLATLLAAEVIPPGADGQLDLGTAPRRVLFLTLELCLVMVIGLPLAALLQPFLPAGALLLALAVLVIALAIWRAAGGLHGHVRAGSALIIEALAAQTHTPAAHPPLAQVEAMLPGFAGLVTVSLAADSPAVGRTLIELALRARTGASVLAITHAGATDVPEPHTPLSAGDVLALAGSEESVALARTALLG